jgi:4'-phosphopantetheinyl transferase
VAAPELRSRLRATLTDDERARAERFVRELHRDRFVVARAALRDVLARMLAVPPESVRFRYDPGGKPRLEVPDRSGLRFNLSHSGDMALVALTLDQEIGVDVEALRSLTDVEALAERFFAPGETAALRSLPEPERETAFLRCWTLKEAYVKAVGQGLAMPLDRFEVAFTSDGPEPALRVVDDHGNAAPHPRFKLRGLDPGPGYVGALAREGPGWRVDCFEWSARNP